MPAQAQSEVAQLQSQLQDAVIQQEALQQALHDMQSTIAVLRDQIQQQAVASPHPEAYAQPGTQKRDDSSAMQQLTQVFPASGLVQALQQQVEDLRKLSACLSNSQQQQQQQLKHQLTQAFSLDRAMHHSRGVAGPCGGLAEAHGGIAKSPRGLSASGAGLKHDCMMPPPGPRSVPNRRLPMSSYASPASHPDPHLTDVIKALHHTRQSTADASAGDKCWCGRPKKLTGSTVGTPSKRGTAGAINGVSSVARQQRATMHTPSRLPDRCSLCLCLCLSLCYLLKLADTCKLNTFLQSYLWLISVCCC